MFKNLSIRQISLFISLIVWFVGILFFGITFYLNGEFRLSLLIIIIVSLLNFSLIYLTVRYFTQQFIFRKVKLIYKVISESKDSLEGKSELSSNTILEDVNTTVMEWAEKKDEEISSLKSLENYRKQYLGDVSHELKTPLFGIQGYLHTLAEGGLYDEKINMKYLKKAIDNTDRLQDIIENLELINSLEARDDDLTTTDFDIKSLFLEVFSSIELLASEQNINLMFKSGADTSYRVKGDMSKIRQVIVNLLTNSIKYGTQDGYTKVSLYDMEEKILVEVSDDGIGISQEDIKHVFNRFYRADKSRNRNIGGSGLGLAIVKHIIEAHNEKLTLRSTYGEGSTFGFTLAKAK